MASHKSYVYPGWGEWARENAHYVQAVRTGDTIHIAGQGGWDPNNKDVDRDNLFPAAISDEIDRAFANVDHNLRYAGGQGFVQVYKVHTYSTDIPSQHQHIVRNLKKWMPDHPAVWTEIKVRQLGAPTMHFEIEVEAYDPKSSKVSNA